MIKELFKGRLKVALSTALLVCMLAALFCACGAENTHSYTLSENIITSQNDLSLSKTESKGSKKTLVTSSGILNLYFDKKTASPILKINNRVWRALPEKAKKSAEDVPAVFTLEVIHEGQRYLLNSQQDGVKNSVPVCTKTENAIIADYVLTVPGENVQITVPLMFYLEDGSFFASINCRNIKSSDDEYIVTKIRLLDFFGSDTGSSSGDYILVPDNSGAVIDTHNAKKSFKGVSLKVYGDAEENNAVMGAYGVKKNDSAFVAIIEKGDAIATINAKTAASSGYNRVGAQFELRETQIIKSGDKDKVYISGESYNGEIKICYRFIEGNNANYSGMAIACREHLIRTGVLSADTVSESGDLPFMLSTIGEATAITGKPQVMTSYEQLLDMLTYLKGKGFSNILVRYKGALTGGLNQNNITECGVLKELGTAEQYKELSEYMSAQQMPLFYDLGFVTFPTVGAKSSYLSRDLSGSVRAIEKTNLLGVSARTGLLSYDRIEDNVIGIFDLSYKNDISNICVNDASSFLYSDPGNGATRAEVKDLLNEESASLTTIGELMVEKGNFYMIKNASYISSLSLSPSNKETKYYISVPFIPLVLHATTQYSSEPLNLSEDFTKSMLRCVEYGALPQFEWCYEDVSEPVVSQDNEEETTAENSKAESEKATESQTEEIAQEETISPYSYSGWATNAYAFYEKANRALGDIKGLRMTAHYEVQNKVFCTEYGDTSIYVNYSSKDVTIGGVTIPAKDFMRVN